MTDAGRDVIGTRWSCGEIGWADYVVLRWLEARYPEAVDLVSVTPDLDEGDEATLTFVHRDGSTTVVTYGGADLADLRRWVDDADYPAGY